MKVPYVSSNRCLSRRHVLRGAGGVALSLPLLEAMQPVFGKTGAVKAPRRFVAICGTLGFYTPYLFPNQAGKDYVLTPYLEKIKNHRDKFTVCSGLSHPQQQGNDGHASELTWLTSAQRPGLAGFRNSISIDQLIAQKVGLETRFPYLALSTAGRSMSWTANGVEIPSETSPEKIFKAMFVKSTASEMKNETKKLQRGRSIMDTVMSDAKKLDAKLGVRDQQKLEEYLAAVRDLELQLEQSTNWVLQPKPDPKVPPIKDEPDRLKAIERQKLIYELITLAFKTDSTRTVTFQISGMNNVPAIEGVQTDWHNLSHHGKDPAKIAELKIIEAAEFEAFNTFLDGLAMMKEQDQTLLDHTSILYGSNLGNASAHDWHNVPIVVAGGGFRHVGHLAGNTEQNTPLANLFVSFAQQMGLEVDSFGSSTQAGLKGLELV